MQKPEPPLKTNVSKGYGAKKPMLFVIPNPFDENLPHKKGWYVEVKRIEEVMRSVRVRMNELAEMQAQHRNAIQTIREYCLTMSKKPGKMHK